MEKLIIPDTSLCAIVRDETINSAGGIIRFVSHHSPHVEEVVIVDTGSIDGTRQVLEELQSKYANLRVHDYKFRGYAQSRNMALGLVKTKRALILDADERIISQDISKLINIIKENPHWGYNFKFLQIYFNSTSMQTGHNPRLFTIEKGTEYKGKWEHLYFRGIRAQEIPNLTYDTEISIKHFVPEQQTEEKKTKEWYDWTNGGIIQKIVYIIKNGFIPKAPSLLPSFAEWKQINPKESQYF